MSHGLDHAPIAVVISTYNQPQALRLVLEAWGEQSDQNFAIYIADDGSGRETRELIQSMTAKLAVPVHHLWHEDQGFRKARIHNQVFKQVKESYLILTDGDCMPLPDMVKTHRQFASRGYFINGSRILLSQRYSRELCVGAANAPVHASWWMWLQLYWKGACNRLLPLWIPPHVRNKKDKLSGIRGCHFSLWMDDLRAVNGFDEAYEGWGREDSDLAARLLHHGLFRRDLKGEPVLHLWHHEEKRERLDENDALLAACLAEKRIYARIGLEELS